MYIHLGADLSLLKKSVIAVINLEKEPPSGRIVTDLIRSEDESGRLQYLTEDLPRSVVVTDEGTFITSLSSQLILKRLNTTDLTMLN
ncbi:MAG: DUF370 domain-containing protein [Clostridiales bacterium]|nr:DUF370 domain-containing protein [Clostridiales bacterium]